MTSSSLGYWAILKVPDDATDAAGGATADAGGGKKKRKRVVDDDEERKDPDDAVPFAPSSEKEVEMV